MSRDKLGSMANQIASFFKTQPGEDQAERVAAHINDFWAPPMRAQLHAQVAADETSVDPVVRDAMPFIRLPA